MTTDAVEAVQLVTESVLLVLRFGPVRHAGPYLKKFKTKMTDGRMSVGSVVSYVHGSQFI